MTRPTPDPSRGEEVVALDRKHVFHSWSAQGAATFSAHSVVQWSSTAFFWAAFRLSYLPLFVRAGARIPVAAARAGQTARHDDPVSDILAF